MKPWEKYKAKPWEKYQDAQAYGDESQAYGDEEKAYEQENLVKDYGSAALGGANAIVPAVAGMPVDTMQNLVNLGIAGYGSARKALGDDDQYIPPAPLPDMPGGSKWMKEKISNLAGTDLFGMPDPTDPVQQNIHMGSGILAAGGISPAASAKQMAGNVARMAPSALGAVAAKEAFPDQPLAPIAGMLAAPAGMQAVQALKAKAPSVSRAFMKAHKLGFKVPPAAAKEGSLVQNMAEGFAGTTPASQKASLYNQKLINKYIKDDIGYPQDAPISIDGLKAIRSKAGKAYDRVSKAGMIITDKTYATKLNDIAQKGSALSKEFPQLVKKDIDKLVGSFSKNKLMSSEATVEAIKQLRADSSAGYASLDPGTKAIARAQGRLADALDGLLERNLAQTNPGIVPELKEARQRIAKTYTIQKALKGENVDAVKLASALDKDEPLIGIIKDIAEFGGSFPKAAQVKVPQYTTIRPMDYAAGIGGAMIDPVYAALLAVRPATRSVILSKPYQNMLAKAAPDRMKQIKTLPKEAQAAAIISLFDDIQKSGNIDSR